MGRGMGSGAIGAPLARLFANLIVMGSGVLGRHFLEAYKAALQNGGAAAAGAAATKTARRVGGLSEADARTILNVKPKATDEEIHEVHPAGALKLLTLACSFAASRVHTALTHRHHCCPLRLAGARSAHGDERPEKGRIRLPAAESRRRARFARGCDAARAGEAAREGEMSSAA